MPSTSSPFPSRRSNRRSVGLSVFLAMLLALVPLPQPGKATTVIPPDFPTMVSRAEVIFRGKVTAVRSEWANDGPKRYIVSYITFNVLATMKGTPASPYVMKMLGGEVGGQGMEITGLPKFHVGETSLLFIEHNGTQFFPVVGLMHGYFPVTTDAKTGQEMIYQYNGTPLQATAQINQIHAKAVASGGVAEPAPAPAATPMKRADFEQEIRLQVAAEK